MITRKLSILCVASTAAVLAACSSGNAPASPPSASASASASSTPSLIANVVDHALDRADAKLRTQNITISDHDGPNTKPKAEITPDGDLLIAGNAVALTPAQRTEVLAYREQVIQIGQQGIAIGKQGATLGMHVASEALAAAFSGQSEQQIRQHAEAQASGIRQSAMKICDRLPELKTTQQKLATDLPAFRPYATLTQKDIDDCRKGSWKDDDNN